MSTRGRCETPGRRTAERTATVGGPRWQLPVSLLGAAALAQIAGAVALLGAAPDLALGIGYGPDQLAAAHLLGLGFLTIAIAGAMLQLVPVLLRQPLGTLRRSAAAGVALVAGSWSLAGGLWSGDTPATAAGGTLLVVGGTLFLVDLGIALVRAARAGTLGAPGAGLVVSGTWFALVLAIGATMAANRIEPFLDVDRMRLIAAHAAIALIGWIGGTIVAMALRLAPMFSLAHGYRRGAGTAALATWHASVVPIALGLGLGIGPLAAAGGGVLLVACGLAGWFVVDVTRHRRRRAEAPLVHLVLGIASAAAACVIMLASWAGAANPYSAAIPAALLFLVGTGAGVTSGHLFKVVPMLVWTGRYARMAGTPGAPKLADLYPAALAAAELAAFTAGLALVAGGAAAGSVTATRIGAVLLIASATAVAGAVAVCVLRDSARPGARTRPQPALDLSRPPQGGTA